MDAISALEERLQRYPADRYPVQRATALFHLGTVLVHRDPERARLLASESAELFSRARLREEEAKARNALGAALRELGALDEAAAAFVAAAAELSGTERAAALFNLGLVQRLRGCEDALEHLEAARAAFAEADAPETAAAERELGVELLMRGDAERAAPALEDALARADRAGDTYMIGAGANALGLAYLALGRAEEAVRSLSRAAAAHPRSLRPAEHAMAKANLARAYDVRGDAARARAAARQALALAEAPEAVRAHALAVLATRGDPVGDLGRILDHEPRESWAAAIRDELARWNVDAEALEREAAAWTEYQDDDLAEAMLAALLEAPPEEFERVLGALLAGATEETRAQLERAASHFHAPQELRVRETIERVWSSRAT